MLKIAADAMNLASLYFDIILDDLFSNSVRLGIFGIFDDVRFDRHPSNYAARGRGPAAGCRVGLGGFAPPGVDLPTSALTSAAHRQLSSS